MTRIRPSMNTGPAASRNWPVAAAGWLAVALGASHLPIAAVNKRRLWADIRAHGWWNTVTLDEPTTLNAAQRSEAFWATLGSFGVPMVALGAHLIWSAQHGHPVPRWLGGLVLSWGFPFVTVMPASPGWALPVIGGLVLTGSRRDAPG